MVTVLLQTSSQLLTQSCPQTSLHLSRISVISSCKAVMLSVSLAANWLPKAEKQIPASTSGLSSSSSSLPVQDRHPETQTTGILHHRRPESHNVPWAVAVPEMQNKCFLVAHTCSVLSLSWLHCRLQTQGQSKQWWGSPRRTNSWLGWLAPTKLQSSWSRHLSPHGFWKVGRSQTISFFLFSV